eukprot:Gb_14106 [translate_table: standard]
MYPSYCPRTIASITSALLTSSGVKHHLLVQPSQLDLRQFSLFTKLEEKNAPHLECPLSYVSWPTAARASVSGSFCLKNKPTKRLKVTAKSSWCITSALLTSSGVKPHLLVQPSQLDLKTIFLIYKVGGEEYPTFRVSTIICIMAHSSKDQCVG